MDISVYFIEFMIYSFLGWIHECLFCMVKDRRWDNRGFLLGPCCPIYGVGATITNVLFGRILIGEQSLWKVFFICAIGSFVLEYATSYFLEKRFQAVWWDYFDWPLNINGRVCLPATLCFGIAGVLFYKYVMPLSVRFHALLPQALNEGIALFLMAVFAADLIMTVESLIQISKRLGAIEERFNEQMQSAYETVEQAPGAVKAALHERVREYAGQMSHFQRRTFGNIKRFSTRFSAPSRRALAEVLKASVLSIRNKTGRVIGAVRKKEDTQEKENTEKTREENG